MFRDIVLRVRALLQRNAMEGELDRELRFHLEHEITKNMGRGMSKEEAMRQAKLDLGGFEQVKEESRDARGVSLLETVIRDLRYAVRVLRKDAGFTVVAVLSLALGVGANTAIFQLLDAIRIRTLPVKAPPGACRHSDRQYERGERSR